MSKASAQKVAVIIVGGGVTGLSCAYHLKSVGFQDFTLIDDSALGQSRKETEHAAGIIAGGLLDNFTRLSHAFGDKFAKELWEFGQKAFLETIDFLKCHDLPFSQNLRLRLITSEHELTEAKLAVKQLNEAGFKTLLHQDLRHLPIGCGVEEKILAIQDEGLWGACLTVRPFINELCQQIKNQIQIGHATKLKLTQRGVVLRLQSGEEIEGEILVLANHLSIARFLPSLEEVLVPTAEQWTSWRWPDRVRPWDQSGLVFSTNHNLALGGNFDQDTIHFGGARYLRKLAGIGATEATVEPKITPHLEILLKTMFNFQGSPRALKTFAGIDCRPCDELPVIGPMYGENRILLAAGYMGQGLTFGFKAGRSLAQLITEGKAKDLPRRLWPERLRSL